MGKKICNALSMLLFCLLLIIAIALFVPKLFGYQQYAVLSGSMEPSIGVGAMVFDAPFEEEKLTEGTIITYKVSDETYVTHRVLTVKPALRLVITKGDANESEDAAVSFDEIVGICYGSIPKLGYLFMYAGTPAGKGMFCGLLLFIILLNILPDIFMQKVSGVKKSAR